MSHLMVKSILKVVAVSALTKPLLSLILDSTLWLLKKVLRENLYLP